jgi:predicted nuclease of predicted toxin-antitoxin system
MHKLLLDENLSPWVALHLQQEGRDVAHIRDRGMLGEPDHVVLERAFAEDRVFVTANVGDFRRLAAAREIHAGIVLLEDGALNRHEQLEVLRRVLNALDGESDLVNRALVVTLDGGLDVEEIPTEPPA